MASATTTFGDSRQVLSSWQGLALRNAARPFRVQEVRRGLQFESEMFNPKARR